MNKLRIGVVGLGGIAQRHGCPCWALVQTGHWKGHFHLRGKKRSVSVIRRIPYVDSLVNLAQTCDAVFVHSSTATHYAVVSELLNAGVHVCVDKPLAENLHEAEQLVDW